MSELTHLSLFTGIGGLDIAGEWAGFRTVGQCEWADYPRKVLEKHWPGLPRWRDIRTLTKESFYEQTGLQTVTVLSGGFPCQPFSTAGKRRGKEDDRYLWPEMLRVISEIRPRWVFGENVAGLVSMALDTVLSDLEGIGYTCQALIIPACAVDAPHRRDRVAIVAHADKPRQQGCEQYGAPDQGGETKPHRSIGECSTTLADTNCSVQSVTEHPWGWRDGSSDLCKVYSDSNNRCGNVRWERQLPAVERDGRSGIYLGEGAEKHGCAEWWPAEPDVGRVANGIPFRVDRLKCLGNAVVPQWAYPLFRAIAEIEAAPDGAVAI